MLISSNIADLSPAMFSTSITCREFVSGQLTDLKFLLFSMKWFGFCLVFFIHLECVRVHVSGRERERAFVNSHILVHKCSLVSETASRSGNLFFYSYIAWTCWVILNLPETMKFMATAGHTVLGTFVGLCSKLT